MGNLATEKVQLSIQNLREKKARIYFFVQDTKGNAKASIRLIYQMADALRRDGFNPIMLHEKKDFDEYEKNKLIKEKIEVAIESFQSKYQQKLQEARKGQSTNFDDKIDIQ